MSARLAVLMAVRNGPPDLPAAVDSIRQQTVPDFELLISDEGSGDGTSELLASYVCTDAHNFRRRMNLQ